MKLKNILIALMMVIGSTLMAQDKYEQAVVWQQMSGIHSVVLSISIEGQPYKVNKVDSKDCDDLSPLFQQIRQMQNEGWEVINQLALSPTSNYVRTTYFLRRKLK